MKKIVLVTLASISCTTALAADDARELVKLPAPMEQHMLANMRDHLAAIAEIQRALGDTEYQKAADIAEQRIGLSSLETHGAAHLAPYLPKAMQDIGTRMHKAASRFSLAAQESAVDGYAERTVGALAKVTEQCVACHNAYRVR